MPLEVEFIDEGLRTFNSVLRTVIPLLALWLATNICGLAKPVLQYNFETKEQVEAFKAAAGKDCEITVSTDLVHSGKQALRLRPTILGALNAGVPLPAGFHQGHLSFWFYDTLFSYVPEGSQGSSGWALSGQQTNPQPKWGQIQLEARCSEPYWLLTNSDDRERTPILRRPGWVKFDVVLEPEGPDRSAIVYIDGQEAARLSAAGFTPDQLGFQLMWGSEEMLIDDLVVDDDPASFHPAAVRSISVGDEANNVSLLPGQDLSLKLALDAKGAQAARGRVQIELLDLQEKSIEKDEFPVDWSAVKDSSMTVTLPAPPTSRHYWVVASYRDAGTPEDAPPTLGKINVQRLTTAEVPAFREKQDFFQPWDWLPFHSGDAATPPASWTNATKIANFWTGDADKRFRDVTAGWYRRSCEIPKSWAGRQILLRIEEPETLAKVFVNGAQAGEVTWPGGEVDLTGKVNPGEKAELVLWVDSKAPTELTRAIPAAMGKDTAIPDQFQSQVGGLGGEVCLVSQPPGAKIARVEIAPHVSKMQLDLQFRADNLTAGQSYVIEGTVSKGGKVVKSFRSDALAVDGVNGSAQVEIPWADAELWDLGQPNLYDLNAHLVSGGKTVDAMLPQRFGFREVTFEGRLVKINGQPVNFFLPMPTYLVGNFGFVSAMKRSNMNFVSNFHDDYYSEGGEPATIFSEDQYALCDEAGFGADLGLSDVTLRKYLNTFYFSKGQSLLDDPLYWQGYGKVVRRAVERYGNRASLFFYLGGGNGGNLEMGGTFNPMKMDGIWLKTFDDRPMLKQFVAVEEKAKDIIHQLDPRKPVIGQDAGNFNDAIHITSYLGFLPMQEFIEHDSYWEKWGTKPFFITEQSAPFELDWTSVSRMGQSSGDSSISYVAEKSAATKGDAAFHRQQVDQEELTQFEERCAAIRHDHPGSRATSWPPIGPLYAYQREPGMPSIFRDVNYERAREQWLNWRAEGLGMLCKWVGPILINGGLGQAIADAWAPLTGYIAGPPDRRTDKTHLLRPGEVWERQFLVLNNRRDPATVECKWSAVLNGTEIRTGLEKVTVSAGGQTSVPLEIKMPAGNRDGSGLLSVTLLEEGRSIASDRMDFQVLAASTVKTTARIAVIDPEGASAEALSRIGVKFQRLNFNADLSGYDVIVFGRRAFSDESAILASPLDLGELMAEGKRVLILEQEESVLRGRFAFRTENESPRYMFGRIAGHPVTAGLSDDALHHWRGAATLTDGYAAARTQNIDSEMNGARMFIPWNDGAVHPRQLTWGNNHNVATVVVDKPDRGNFRTLVDAEYGLDYAVIFEVERDAGKMVFCQADVSGRTEADPASERLLSNLIAYLDPPAVKHWTSGVAYLGGDKGAKLMDDLQVIYRRIQSPEEAKPDETLVLGEGLSAETLASWKSSISQFVEQGGSCLSLPRGKDEWNWLPFAVTVKDAQVDSTPIDKPSDPLLAGLSNGDLYYAGRLNVVALTSVPKGGFVTDSGVLADVPYGKGRYAFCQVSPESFDVGTRFYLEASQKHSYRVFQVLLNNLGAPMRAFHFLDPTSDAGTQSSALPPIDLAPLGWQGIKTPPGTATVPSPSDPGWTTVKVPGYVNDQRPEWNDNSNFVFWYRCHLPLKDLSAIQSAKLHIGAIEGEDDIWVNGTQIGHTGRDTNSNDWEFAVRYYTIPPTLLKEGDNEIIVRVNKLGPKIGISVAPVRLVLSGAGKPDAQSSLMTLANLPPVDLATTWKVLLLNPGETALPPDSDSRWASKSVPGLVIYLENRDAWCQRDVQINEIPAGAKPELVIGAVDDEDDTYINGTLIGHTGKDTNPKDYWMAPRAYPIPDGLLKIGSNRITIKVNNFVGDGSISPPMEITWMPPEEAAKLRLSVAPYLFGVDQASDPYWWQGGW
jgi:beta-galactosidase